MTDDARLYFNIGPVQSFVAQARRTRDLWAGSFLLSHLSNAAMAAVEARGGRIVLPDRKSSSTAPGEDSAKPFGTVPNRFIAENVDAAGARAAVAALQDTWDRIAQAVWDAFVAPVTIRKLGNETQRIWDRQVKHFWEITWVIGPPGWLEARKHWRTPPLRVEGGDHCAVMGDLQELSGYVRAQDRHRQDEFWAAVRERCNALDLAKDERMCAIALIKRLFPKVARDTVKIGFPVQSWPSSSYLAAAPWLARVAARQPGDEERRARGSKAMQRYAEQVESLAPGAMGERYTRIACLSKLGSEGSKFLRLHGNFFFEEQLENANRTPFDRDELTDAQRQGPEAKIDPRRQALVKELRALYDKVGSRPAPYFALLKMDGDSMGQLLALARDQAASEGPGETVVTHSLRAFADAAPALVHKNNGVTVYAGGDDVVALLPARDALACAAELAQRYQQCFARHCAAELTRNATLSGAIVYAHYSTPLRQILETAHRLLDDVAKEATGRDSLAIGVIKGDTLVCEWSAPWAHLREEEATDSTNLLEALVQKFRSTGNARASELGSTFLFGLRAWLTGLCEDAREEPGTFGRLPAELAKNDENAKDDKDYVHALLVAEYLRARATSEERDASSEGAEQQARELAGKQAEELMEKLLRVCRRVTREPARPPETAAKIYIDKHSFGFDGPYLIRFLALEVYKEET